MTKKTNQKMRLLIDKANAELAADMEQTDADMEEMVEPFDPPVTQVQVVHNVLGGETSPTSTPTLTQDATLTQFSQITATTLTKQPSTTSSTAPPASQQQPPLVSPPDNNELQGTGELSYPSSFEQMEDTDQESGNDPASTDDDSPPAKKQASSVMGFVSGGPLQSVSAPEGASELPTRPAYFVKPQEYDESKIEPYTQPKLKLDFMEPLTEDQVREFEKLQPLAEDNEHPNYTKFVQLRVQRRSHERWLMETSTLFKKRVNKRWKLHYQNIIHKMSPNNNNPNLSQAEAKQVYIECTSYVRTDLEKTPMFKEHWYSLCEHNNLFKVFQIPWESITQ